MLERIAKESGHYLYSFWNPQVANQEKLKKEVDAIFLLFFNPYQYFHAVQKIRWETIYAILQISNGRAAEQEGNPVVVFFNYLIQHLKSKHLSDSTIDAFWIAFGKNQGFPMGELFWHATIQKKLSAQAEFGNYFKVVEMEKRLNEQALFEYFIEGNRNQENLSRYWPAVFSFNKTTSADAVHAARLYWGAVIQAHWDQKVDQLFAKILDKKIQGYWRGQFISDTVSDALCQKYYHVFEKLLETILLLHEGLSQSGVAVQEKIANLTVGNRVSHKTLMEAVIFNYQESQYTEYKDPTFLNICLKYLPHFKDKIDPILLAGDAPANGCSIEKYKY